MDDTSAITWARVEKDFFVASTTGTFLGTIDYEAGRGFTARDMRAMVIGSFPSLSLAMSAVVDGCRSEDGAMT
jgi:hypothetical protein